MIRTIKGFHRDDEGDWVAELSCLHNQHVRHRPPFQERPWVETPEGRQGRIGTPIECPLCDRAELPDGLVVARTAGPWDEGSLPAGLQKAHRVAAATWGVIRIHEGQVGLALPESSPVRILVAGDFQPLPPEMPHRLEPAGPMRLSVDFMVAP